MKINEVEALVGITRKNIRFYESEGLLSPRRRACSAPSGTARTATGTTAARRSASCFKSSS